MLERIAYWLVSQFVKLGAGPARFINRLMINRSVNATRNRPHPWSTRSDYISWSSLTDRTFNARHLPRATLRTLPDTASLKALFAAPPEGQRPCRKSTCLFPAFAQYLTDGFIRTAVTNNFITHQTTEDRRKTTSNHEIDLSPLYGRNELQTNLLRLRLETRGQRGRLKSVIDNGEEHPPRLFDQAGETFNLDFCDAAGNLLLDTPLGIDHTTPAMRATLFAVGGDRVNATPQVAMINTLFLREHNRLAGMIETAMPDWDDERVFQTARNIVIFLFIKIVVEEYINHINPSPLRFIADASVAWRARWNRSNWITAEFSLLYRWHSLIPENMTWAGQSLHGAKLRLNNQVLLNGGLASAFVDVSSNSATALGLRNTATFLVDIEALAIEQARTNGLAGYNAYRAAFGRGFRGLKPKKSFPEITPDADLQSKLAALYGDPDALEFYVGIFAEPVQVNGPLPELIQTMVAVDAFSQALTNPLLSEHVWGNPENRLQAFTRIGLAAIEETTSLRDILARNNQGLGDRFVGMTRPDWVRR